MPNDPIRLNTEDFHSEKVESYMKLREEATKMLENSERQPLLLRIVYASWFYMAIACAIGAFLAWGILEPFFDDNFISQGPNDGASRAHFIAALLMFPTVAAGIGFCLGASEGIMCRNIPRAFLSGIVGLGIGFVGGGIGLIPVGILFGITQQITLSLMDNVIPGEQMMPSGIALMVLMMGRGMSWAILGIPAGLGQGIALREKAVIWNGIIGGAIGGLLGGLLFDPISLVFTTIDGQAAASRCIGFIVIGLSVGIFVGLVENWTKSSWLLMRSGPLAGKQFILHREVTVLGSSPKAQIYLFKDPDIEPHHATINRRSGNCEIVDADTPAGTFVNGVRVNRQHLRSGDRIMLGTTEFEFIIKEEASP